MQVRFEDWISIDTGRIADDKAQFVVWDAYDAWPFLNGQRTQKMMECYLLPDVAFCACETFKRLHWSCEMDAIGRKIGRPIAMQKITACRRSHHPTKEPHHVILGKVDLSIC